MNLIRIARAFGASFALVVLGYVAHAALTLPATQGPFLGDYNVNPYTLALAINNLNQNGNSPALTATGSSSQTGALPLVNPLNQITGPAAGAGVNLPTATAGRIVMVSTFLGGGNGPNIFGSNTPFTVGTNDTINGTAGSTPYNPGANKLVVCMSPANGAWICGSSS